MYFRHFVYIVRIEKDPSKCCGSKNLGDRSAILGLETVGSKSSNGSKLLQFSRTTYFQSTDFSDRFHDTKQNLHNLANYLPQK